MSQLTETLAKLGIKSIRPLQAEVLSELLAGRNVMACLPTAYGKSLCFQLPALVDHELTIVVSPLIATINDQVQSLNSKFGKMVAMRWHSEITADERRAFDSDIQIARLFYCSPESLVHTDILSRILRYRSIKRIVIDEAHYIAQWGDCFRPAFKEFPQRIRAQLPEVQWLVLTATATISTIDTIKASVCNDFSLVLHEPIKPNLAYEHYTRGKSTLADLKLIKLCNAKGDYDITTARMAIDCKKISAGEKTLVFALTRRRVELLTDQLERLGVDAMAYHGGMAANDKERVAKWFAQTQGGVLVATNAFGVGIDIPDIRTVIHVETPLSVDAYVQETGRAGRDGQPARAIYLNADVSHAAGNSLLAYSFPNDASVSAVIGQLYDQCARSLGQSAFGINCYERDFPLVLSQTAEGTKLSSSMVDVILDHLVKSGLLSISHDYCGLVGRFHNGHSFSVSRYNALREKAVNEFSSMKHYAFVNQSETAQYLSSFYPVGRIDKQRLKWTVV